MAMNSNLKSSIGKQTYLQAICWARTINVLLLILQYIRRVKEICLLSFLWFLAIILQPYLHLEPGCLALKGSARGPEWEEWIINLTPVLSFISSKVSHWSWTHIEVGDTLDALRDVLGRQKFKFKPRIWNGLCSSIMPSSLDQSFLNFH
jgi:hypothetical protein